MEPLKQSEEEIIKLGKKIVNELKLDDSVNTLGRWMAHHVAELIYQAENTQSLEEKKQAQKECCETIIKLWNNREHVPNISQPLSNLKPIINLLNSLKEKDFSYPYWRYFDQIPKKTSWNEFVETIKSNSEYIFELCLLALVNEDLLSKEKEWIEDHKEMLTADEKNAIERISFMISRSDSFFVSNNDEIKVENLSIENR